MNELLKIAYQYYPKMDAIKSKEKYIRTKEYKNLEKILMKKNEIPNTLYQFLNPKYDIVKNLTSKTLKDRCLNYQIYFKKENKFDILVINVSFLAPYFTIYILEVESKGGIMWKNLPRRNFHKEQYLYSNEINEISLFLQIKLNLLKFPEKHLNKTIPNINFQDIELGRFTFFNAFFINEYTITI